MVTEEKCANCRYWRHAIPIPRSNGMAGQCRRNAPSPAFTGKHPAQTWPTTTDTDWCGAWQYGEPRKREDAA